MQSNNPVFRRSEEFNRTGAGAPYNSDPSTWSTGGGVGVGYGSTPPTHAPVQTGPMTIDSVVQKTGISLGVVIVAAIATWIVTPDIRDDSAALGPLYSALVIGSLAAFALSMVNSFKRVVSPGLVLAFAVAEGITLGAFSKVIDSVYETDGGHGLVTGAVVGTFAAFAGTLTAYKMFNIKVTAKFRMFVMAAVFGMIALSLMELVLGAFGSSFGLFGVSNLGILTAVAGLALGVFMLILDFDFVEQGIANQLPERESWRAAFALTVSLVWIYTNLLRLLAIFSDS